MSKYIVVTFKIENEEEMCPGFAIITNDNKPKFTSSVLEEYAAMCAESYHDYLIESEKDVKYPFEVKLEMFFDGESKGKFDVEVTKEVFFEAHKLD